MPRGSLRKPTSWGGRRSLIGRGSEFDFNYGLAPSSGHYEDAIFALERVVFLRPDILRLRLELARAHFLNETLRMRATSVCWTCLTPNVTENIGRFLEQMDAIQPSKRRQISLGGSSEAATTPTSTRYGGGGHYHALGTFDPVGDGQAQSDEFTRWEVGAARAPG